MKIEIRLSTLLLLLAGVAGIVWYLASQSSRVASIETKVSEFNSRNDKLDSRVGQLELVNVRREERWAWFKAIDGFLKSAKAIFNPLS